MPTEYILLIIVAILALVLIAIYNTLVRLRNRTEEAWSDIDVQLKRRYNLIPNLIETVKGYASHEKKVFTDVTEARNNALSAEEKKNPKEIKEAENQLEGALKTLFAVAENYPDLKANANFLDLQRELSDTENKIQAARRFYNTTVRELNTKIELFPYNTIAGMFNFKNKNYFEIGEEDERAVPSVSFEK
jgi:LemA protein